jgi:protein-disulfide isomerase
MSSHRLLAVLLAATGTLACTSPSTTQAKQETGAPTADPNAPVAKVGGQVITARDLDESAKGQLQQLDNQYQEQRYQMRRSALEQMIVKRLVEAKAAGKPVEEFLQAELMDKIPDPTDAELKRTYDAAKAPGRELPPFPQVKDQIVKYMKQQQAQQALATYVEKLKADAKVEILLAAYKPPRVTVEAKGPAKGPDKAPITIVEFSDFECPYCSRAETVVAEVLRAYPDKIRIVYRDFPLPNHPNAVKAAEAAHCAGDQGKYWEMHAKLFSSPQALDVKSLKGNAKALGLDPAKFDACLDGGGKARLVEENKKAGAALGVTGTPAFFVNGIMINGAQPFEAFKEVIDAELAPVASAK